MSLKEPQLKMSKSHTDKRSRIDVNDTPRVIGDKIKFALTDSIAGVSYDPISRPGVSNLLAIMSYFDNRGRTAEELVPTYSNMDIRDFKSEVTKAISTGLESVRERYNSLLSAEGGKYLDDVAMLGSVKARAQAKTTMAVVRHAVGL